MSAHYNRARIVRAWTCGALALCVTACARQPMLADPTAPTAVASVDTSPRLAPGIYDVQQQTTLTREALLERLAGARFVVVGETHDDLFHHQVQRQLHEALVRRAIARDAQVLIGMEMFQVPFQAVLDEYVAGTLTQGELLERAEWSTRWNFPVAFYEPLWQLAKTSQSRVVALNAPREVTRRISQVGLEALTADERAQVASELDLSNQAHRAWFASIFASHGMPAQGREEFERFYAAQVSWDETMAQTAVSAMASRAAPDQMLIVAGSGHVMNQWGIPSRIARRAPDTQVLTLIPVSSPASSPGLKAPTGATQRDLVMWKETRFADFVWVE